MAFYLMEAIGGDTAFHDGEYEEAAWFPISEALGKLVFANEVEMLQIAARVMDATIADDRIVDSRA